MNTNHSEFGGFHTWRDTVGCSAVLLALLLGTLSGAYVVYSEAAAVAASSQTPSA